MSGRDHSASLPVGHRCLGTQVSDRGLTEVLTSPNKIDAAGPAGCAAPRLSPCRSCCPPPEQVVEAQKARLMTNFSSDGQEAQLLEVPPGFGPEVVPSGRSHRFTTPGVVVRTAGQMILECDMGPARARWNMADELFDRSWVPDRSTWQVSQTDSESKQIADAYRSRREWCDALSTCVRSSNLCATAGI